MPSSILWMTGGAVVTADDAEYERAELLVALARTTAHDASNIFAAIGTLAEAARRERHAAGDAETRKLDQILAAVESGQRLVRQTLSTVTRSAAQIEPQRLDVVLPTLVDILSGSMPDGVSLEFRIAPRMPSVLAERAHIEQIVTNLIVNARDAMPQGGAIRIVAEPVGAAGWCKKISIEIADSGVGIAPENLDAVFRPSFTTKASSGNAGLGLAICRMLAAQAGGAISVRSAVNQGSVFRVELPCVQAPL